MVPPGLHFDLLGLVGPDVLLLQVVPCGQAWMQSRGTTVGIITDLAMAG